MSLNRLELTPFAVITGEIVQHRRTGYLTIVHPPLRKVLYWSQGELVLVTSNAPEDSLGDFLTRRGILSADRAFEMLSEDPTDSVSRFHDAGLLELSWRQTLLREWTAAQFIPLFSLDEGTAAFTDDDPLEPEKRVFLQSTAALILEGIRSISNGLVLRRSLGDLKRDIGLAKTSRFDIESIPLTEIERKIANSLTEPMPIEAFLKQFPSESLVAAKVVIGMLSLGIFSEVEIRSYNEPPANFDDMQRDLELLAAIGPNDPRSLRAVSFSRQLSQLDHYQVLDIPRAATRAQILAAGDAMKRAYDPATFPPVVRESLQAINRRIDDAVDILKEPTRRAAYDKLIHESGGRRGATSIEQRMAQRSIADQNYQRALTLSIEGDHFGAIVLLKQAAEFAPDRADVFYLLGCCQERNPKWRRDAAESFQKALSIDPNYVDAMISLGDLYKNSGFTSRAQTCYEDALKIVPDHQEAKSRLSGLKAK